MIAQVTNAAGLRSDDFLVAQNIAFAIIAVVMVYAAIRVVTTRNIVHAALYLVITLAGVGAQFILLGAEFVAATQVLVYIGAVVVLFLFGIMLTRARLGVDESAVSEGRWMAMLVAVLLLVVIGYSVIDGFDNSAITPTPNTTAQTSDTIFGQYLVAFEAVSVLLLAALIGAIVIARKD